MLRWRHCSASAPPGVTPEQFAMKSERQFERIASRCASVGCADADIALRQRPSAARIVNLLKCVAVMVAP